MEKALQIVEEMTRQGIFKAHAMKNRAAEIIFRKKRERRRRLAKLHYKKKIEIVVELQKAAAAIRQESFSAGPDSE
jgi:hypothetical protein